MKVYQRASTVVGTIAAVVGKGGKIKFIPRNFRNPDKAVTLVLEAADGLSDTVVCSKPLSAALRSKELTLSNLVTLEIVEFVTNEGTIINMVQMPGNEANRAVEFAIDEIKPKAYKAPKATIEDFTKAIAL